MKRQRLLHNYKLKAMSLLLAILSWLIVKQITNNDKVVSNVPVRITLPEGWAIRDKDINTVQVTFRGTREDLANLDRKTVQINIDMRNEAYEPVKVVSLQPRQVTFAGGNTRVTAIRPDIIKLQMGKEVEKQFPVLVNESGEPPEGFKVEALEVVPSLATLVGAEDLLDSINALQTEPLNLSDKIQSFEQRLAILPPNPELVARVEPSSVLVKVTLAGLTVEREFLGVPLILTHPAGQETPLRQVVEPQQVDVFLKGSPQLLDRLDIRRIQAFVAAENLDRRKSEERRIHVLVPAGIEVLATRPEIVILRTLPPPTPTPLPTATPVPTATPTPPQPKPTATAVPAPAVQTDPVPAP